MSLRSILLLALVSLASPMGLAQGLPLEVQAALQRAKVPPDAVSLLVVDADGKAAPRLSHRASVAMNPASVMKLVTTYAALDLLGPAYTWRTPVYADGTVRDGTLAGNLYIKGQGDPKLVLERLWLLLRRLQGLGIRSISGDIVLDQSAFEPIEADPASFDGEPLRPYNAAPEALLLNFKAVVMTFAPQQGTGTATVQFDPPLAGVQMQARVPLGNADCGNYRALLKADFSDPRRIGFAGSYPASCGEKTWAQAYADPSSYNERAVAGLWQEMGGKLGGVVRTGRLPAALSSPLAEPLFELTSPPLAEVIRDINKYSNNVMAQQLFLTLSLPERAPGGVAVPNAVDSAAQLFKPASRQASRELVARWWSERIGPGAPLLDNGAGLSREGRISAQALAALLQNAYRSPLMPELMSSLPIVGIDGTLRRSRAQAQGNAHLKTGSLRDVNAIAGYVHAASGRLYVLVAIANHSNAAAARPAFEALVDWAINDNQTSNGR